MYSHLLDKPLNNYDISVFENYGPDTILDYHHHSEWEVSLNTYWMLKEKHQNSENPNPFLEAWVNFFDEVLGAGNDLHLAGIGQISLIITRLPIQQYILPPLASEPVTAADVAICRWPNPRSPMSKSLNTIRIWQYLNNREGN